MAVASVGTDSDLSEIACKKCANNLDIFSCYVCQYFLALRLWPCHKLWEITSKMVVVTWVVT